MRMICRNGLNIIHHSDAVYGPKRSRPRPTCMCYIENKAKHRLKQHFGENKQLKILYSSLI